MQRLELDIADIRKLFGDKYDDGIREMLEYARTLPEFQRHVPAMCEVEIDDSVPVFGRSYAGPGGYIAIPGRSPFRHRFGGDSWLVDDFRSTDAKPSLVVTLDLADPLLSELRSTSLDELPLCSFLAYDIGSSVQLFQIDPNQKRVICIQRGTLRSTHASNAAVLALEEKSLTLVPMTDGDLPTSESEYWNAPDLFLGGGRFIRVLGPPLWLYAAEIAKCDCGRRMSYVAAIGCENRPPYSQLIENEPVFFGEMGLYWFFCERCLTVAVTSQSS